jgi:hypothetical protein
MDNTARSPETSLAGITRIGCKGSLSASLVRLPADAREAPLFRQKLLNHESQSRCKPGLPAQRSACVGGSGVLFRRHAHSGTMPRTRFAERSRELSDS